MKWLKEFWAWFTVAKAPIRVQFEVAGARCDVCYRPAEVFFYQNLNGVKTREERCFAHWSGGEE